MTDVTMDKIVSLCRRRGFVFPSSEIYGGLGSTYDYGHYGVLMKNHIRSLWLRAMVQERDDIVAIDSAVILNPAVWEASGHVAGFSDPLDRLPHLQAALPRRPARGRAVRPEAVSKRPGEYSECDLTEPRQFNLMFETQVGAMEDAIARRRTSAPRRRRASSSTSRTCSQLARRKPPFGIAQIGKSFRNEITPGNFLFRVREFEQMEMEFFVPPAEAEHVVPLLDRAAVSTGTCGLGLRESMLRVREHDAERALALLERRRATSSTCIRSAGRSSRASRTAATST